MRATSPGFVNRELELSALRRWWDTPSSRAALVWGRRRVGKTALLQEFAAGKPTVFVTGAGRPLAGELAQLSRAVAEAGAEGVRHLRSRPFKGVRDLRSRPFQDWDDALEHLVAGSGRRRTLLVLDEFPELERSAPDLPGILRAFLDRTGSQSRLRLLVCGSAVRSMEAMQEARAPLFGRFDLRLQLHPFSPAEASLMLPGIQPPDAAVVYGLLGGMPLYLSWWDPGQGLLPNLRHLAGSPGAPLLSEGELVLATEVERGERPAAVLHAIAAGRTRHNEIKDWVGSEPARTLDRLVDLQLVERMVPVTDDPRRSRRRLYRIRDNFLSFYLKVLLRYRAEIDRGLGESILPVLVGDLDDHLGGPWESMVTDHVRRESGRGRFGPNIVAVGRWWRADGGGELDILALAGRARRPVLAGEVKWARSVDGSRLHRRLIRTASAVTAEPESLQYLVAAREEVTHLPRGVTAVTAADVFAREPR